ncbi:hypothetical protein LTR53_011323 [Teratosphaeriaceae sp. CCFEE 6253]|nr:hypothetical protein LTR53_011323 [Teratosphaeriaceae sp. CCFEE 6253]
MASFEREASRDRNDAARHQHSFPENGRSSVPMWDSSDPERAPPPLPFPPGASSPTTKANTSAGIAAAAKQIVERARESAPLSSYTSNQTPQGSPERSLVKGAHHKRLQSLQTGSVKDLRSYLDGNRSPERSPERPASRGGSYFGRQDSREDISLSAERSTTPTPAPKDLMKETPTLRPTTRAPPRAILSENTPPSSTMLALQTMQVPDDPLHDITNGFSTPTPMRVSTNYDFSSQLLNLTTIATNLQKEMSGLSRRSKDNATDLISLKDATNQRDEDIRKSLRELANVMGSTQHLLGPPPAPGSMNRTASSYSFLDSKAFGSPPSASKSWSVPRAASAHSFLEDGRVGSPSPYSVEGAASVAMLEKIIREMVTKEGQERLLSTLSELMEKSQKDNGEAVKRVKELSEFIKEKSETQALVAVPKDGPPKLELNFDSPARLTKITRGEEISEEKAALDREIMEMLKRIKESVAHSGGSTNEVKGLVRDLRGEVLGMGRELGRKLDQVSETQLNSTLDKSIGDGHGQEHAEEVQRIVEEGMADLKEHLAKLMAQRAEQDDDTFRQLSTARSGPSGEEMFAVVKHALAEHGNHLVKREPDESEVNRDLSKEGVLDAVKEGLKDFEPNIELQQFGLERDEILAVLKEGLEEYQNDRPEPVAASIDKGEIFEVMQEALKDFEPPFPAEAMEQMKNDILENVRQALAEHQPAASAPSLDDEAVRTAVTEAVKEGLVNHGPAAPREMEISREDLFDAVKASLDGSAIPFGGFGEQLLQRMHELIDNMRTEFQQYSAANGRDTEQVLDAVKDGLESLRAEIETYVDRAQDVTGKDEILDTVKGGLEQLRGEVQGFVADGPVHDGGKADLLEYIRKEFEHLHETIGNRELGDESTGPRDNQMAEVLRAVNEGMESLKTQIEEKDRELEIDFPTDEIHDAMREEFAQLKTTLLLAHSADKGELVETIQDSMGALHSKLGDSNASALSGGVGEEIINELHQEFDTLKETVQAIVSQAERETVIDGVKLAIEDLRTQLSADNSDVSAETLAAVREELEKFKETMAGSIVLGGAAGAGAATIDHTESLEQIRGSLSELKEAAAARSTPEGPIPTELLEAMRGEFENLRTSIATSVVHNGSNEEVLDAIRLGLDDLGSHIERKLESPDRNQAQQNEMLDAMNEGLESLRTDVVKTLDKPLDMTVNYEILDTLKDGLTSLRADLDALKSGRLERPDTPKGCEIVLAEPMMGSVSREVTDEAEGGANTAPHAPEMMKRSDLEKMEVLLAQLQIKVEAMDATIQEIPMSQPAPSVAEGAAMKEDLALLGAMIKEVQDSIIILAARETVTAVVADGAARKEDTDAIETLLRNTKAQLDDLAMPDHASAASREQLDAMEAVVRVTNEAIDGLTDKIENSAASKADVAVVEILAQDVKAALEELKERMPAPPVDDEKPELMTKADLDVLGVLCTEIKVRVNEVALPNPEDLPSKSDIEQLQGLISDFRESHDKLRDSYETDIAVTAKAFDDRKQEFEDTVQQITSIKDVLAEIKEDLLGKLGDGESGINTLGETLKSIEEKTSDNEPVIAEIKEVTEALVREFERAHGSLEAMKIDHQQSADASLEKQAEHKDAMILELSVKLDNLFDGIMTKYDDAQLAAEEKAKVMEEKSTQQAELLESTKVMADDLRLSIDTLGTALTSFTTTFPDQMDKLTEESKTVYNKVDDTYNKLDETQEGLKYEHSITRDEVAKALVAIAGVQGDLAEHNPRFLVTLKEVQALIGQHYDHSQMASNVAEQHHQAVRDMQEQLRAGFEDSKTRHASQTEELKTAMPALLPALPAPIELPTPAEKYDDSALHDKLDKIMGHAEDAANPSTQLERLDQIHEKVMATAAEVSAFVAAQAKQITEDHENKEREAEELALLLERRAVQKDELEADIDVLNEEKDSLRRAVGALREEKEALAAQKSRMNADVSSLETALRIRREELHEMDHKAEQIERRMLEGVMNQSRMLLLAKGAKSAPPKKQPGRDLRVPSNASVASAQTVTSSVPALKANHAVAMKTRPSMPRNGAMANSNERRIMSLNQINNNVPTGAHALSATPSLASNSALRMQRSHSVRTPFQRKGSWAGKRNLSMTSQNKENETLSEESEDELSRSDARDFALEDGGSDTATERRTSYASGVTYGDGSSYADGVTPYTDDGRRTSYGNSDLSYGTGSYMTGSDLTGRDSLASSVNGAVGVHSAIDEEQSGEEEAMASPAEGAPLQIEGALNAGNHDKEKRHFAPPSDSGLGTDLPTAALTDSEYFGR